MRADKLQYQYCVQLTESCLVANHVIVKRCPTDSIPRFAINLANWNSNQIEMFAQSSQHCFNSMQRYVVMMRFLHLGYLQSKSISIHKSEPNRIDKFLQSNCTKCRNVIVVTFASSSLSTREENEDGGQHQDDRKVETHVERFFFLSFCWFDVEIRYWIDHDASLCNIWLWACEHVCGCCCYRYYYFMNADKHVECAPNCKPRANQH